MKAKPDVAKESKITVKGIENADLEALFRKYGPMVIRRCRQLLKNEDEAADAAQDVFVKVLSKRDTLSVQYPSSLLYTMATNLCLNMIRDRKAHGGQGFEDSDSLLEQIACYDDAEERAGNRSVLRKLFARHPASSRTMAMLHFVDGMTLEETAKEVGMSVAGVRKRLAALRIDLKGA